MRVTLVAAALFATACNDPSGLEMEVVVPHGVTRVELIPATECATCPGELAAPGTETRPEDALTSTMSTRWTGDVADGSATFRLTTDRERQVLLAVIGFADQDVPKVAKILQNIVVPESRGEYWQIRLDDAMPVTGIDDATHPDGSYQIGVWRAPQQTEASCVMVEHWNVTTRMTGAIMPPDDFDCDGKMPECRDNVPNAMNQPPPLDRTSCGAQSSVPAGSVCMLGGAPCSDGVPISAGSCVPIADEPHCIPQAFCGCTLGDPTCQNVLKTDTAVPLVNCVIPVDSNGQACGSGKTFLDLAPYLGATQCSELHFLTGLLQGLHTTDVIPLGGGSVDLTSFNMPCNVYVEAKDALGGSQYAYELLDMDLSNGRHLVIPFRAHTEGGGCSTGAQMTCMPTPVNASESMFNCAR